MTDLEANREYYDHDANCTKKQFTEVNARGIKTCIECAGKFDKDGKGVAVTSNRFDAIHTEYDEPTPE